MEKKDGGQIYGFFYIYRCQITSYIVFPQNRQSFSQLLGDGKASSIKTARVRIHGKRRGRGGAMPLLKHENKDVSSVKETASSISDISKAFSIKFVRLNGILFTRTRYILSTFIFLVYLRYTYEMNTF